MAYLINKAAPMISKITQSDARESIRGSAIIKRIITARAVRAWSAGRREPM
jgi:hypothetical protein